MSLGCEYFEQRSRRLKEYEQQGFKGLDDFLIENRLSLNHCFEIGLVEPKEWEITTQLHEYQLTSLGKKYIEFGDNQLFLVRPETSNQLLELFDSKVERLPTDPSQEIGIIDIPDFLRRIAD
jgi:hypothetical protein